MNSMEKANISSDNILKILITWYLQNHRKLRQYQ